MDYFLFRQAGLYSMELKNKSAKRLPRLFKLVALVCGGFLLFRQKSKLASIIKSNNFIITALYTLIVIFIAIVYRILMVLNWIIQQAR